MVVENIIGYLYGVDMTRQEAINILLDHFSAGFVRTIEDALNKEWVGLTNNEVLLQYSKEDVEWQKQQMEHAQQLNAEALKQEQDEPVAYFSPQKGGFYWAKPTTVTAPVTIDVEPLPFYTTPQGCAECGNGGGYALYCVACVEKFFGKGKEWVGLTDQDMNEPKTHNFDFILGARWAEEILKDRNK